MNSANSQILAESESAALAAADSAAPPPAPKVEDMARARREVQVDHDYKQSRGFGNDADIPDHGPMADHHYYSGPATSRRIPTTDIHARSALFDPVARTGEAGTGASISTGQALYRPVIVPPEHNNYKDVVAASFNNPTRRDVARALEHIQAQEIRSEYFHDKLVDNDAESWHYQQAISVPLVADSNEQGGLFSWNGIGGVFGAGAAFGPSDQRAPVQLHARKDPVSGRYLWHDPKQLNVERVLQTGTSFESGPKFGFWTKDVAQQVLRNAMPEVIKPQFLGYNPSRPPPAENQLDGEPYVHTWAAYTAEGSRRRIEAARAQRRYKEWELSHPKQAHAAENGLPCYNGNIPCEGPFQPGKAWYFDPTNSTGLN